MVVVGAVVAVVVGGGVDELIKALVVSIVVVDLNLGLKLRGLNLANDELSVVVVVVVEVMFAGLVNGAAVEVVGAVVIVVDLNLGLNLWDLRRANGDLSVVVVVGVVGVVVVVVHILSVTLNFTSLFRQ